MNATYSSAMENASGYNKWIVSAFLPYIGRRLMEVGVGHGGFYELLPKLDEYMGVDIDPVLIAKAQDRYPQLSYVVADIAAPDFVRKLGRNTFDTVLCINVMEHVENHTAGLDNLLSALTKGGRLLLFVPAFEFLYTDLDRLAGHHRRYIKKSITDMMDNRKARILRLEYFNPIGGIGWLANRFVKHSSLDSAVMNSQIGLFDKYILPFSRALNPITKSFWGQSIICVVEVI